MKITIQRWKEDNVYCATIKVCGDGGEGFYPFALAYEGEIVSTDTASVSKLEKYVPIIGVDDISKIPYSTFSSEIQLAGTSVVIMQKAIEYIVARVKSSYKQFVRYKELQQQYEKMWDTSKEEVIELTL